MFNVSTLYTDTVCISGSLEHVSPTRRQILLLDIECQVTFAPPCITFAPLCIKMIINMPPNREFLSAGSGCRFILYCFASGDFRKLEKITRNALFLSPQSLSCFSSLSPSTFTFFSSSTSFHFLFIFSLGTYFPV